MVSTALYERLYWQFKVNHIHPFGLLAEPLENDHLIRPFDCTFDAIEDAGNKEAWKQLYHIDQLACQNFWDYLEKRTVYGQNHAFFLAQRAEMNLNRPMAVPNTEEHKKWHAWTALDFKGYHIGDMKDWRYENGNWKVWPNGTWVSRKLYSGLKDDDGRVVEYNNTTRKYTVEFTAGKGESVEMTYDEVTNNLL